jgi:hypothetical protein
MKALLFTWLLMSSYTVVKAQELDAYADRKALQIPRHSTYAADSIAAYILNNFSTGRERARAVYTWITQNIQYSTDSMYYFRSWGTDPEIKMASILRRRKGVCENYAELFAGILNKCGVPAVVITGYTKTGAAVNWTGHGWVAVKVAEEWLLCDPTWDAGKYNSYRYFLVPPAEFIFTHMPFDPMWQLLEQPVSHAAFRQGYYRQKKTEPVFYYNDSVTAYLQSDSLQQMEATTRRMQAAGIENDDLRTWYAYNRMKIHIVQQEENMQLFNDAVADLNRAKKLYNEFVTYRNNGFTPPKTDATVKELFTAMDQSLAAAYKKLENIGKKSANYQYDTEGLQTNLDALSAKVKDQAAFLKRYFELPETERRKLL